MVYYAPLKLWKKWTAGTGSPFGGLEAGHDKIENSLSLNSAGVSFRCSDCNFWTLGACNIPLERS